MTCEHYRDDTMVSKMDALNYYASIFFHLVSDFKFMFIV